MYINVPEEVKELSEIFNKNGETLYVVGGFVRNALMELFSIEHNDIDLCSACKPDKVVKMLSGTKFNADDTYKKYGTVIITTQNRRYEFTTFRRENYHLNGEHNPTGVEFVKDIKEDALRRDFTINAVYYNIETGDIVNPVGGVEDIRDQIVRCPGSAEYSFKEDGERILRMIRFACSLKFHIDEKTLLAAIEKYMSVINLSKERIRREFDKMLICDTFYPRHKDSEFAHARCMIMIGQLGLWKYILPCVQDILDSPMKDDKGELLYDHMINTLSYCEPNARLACLVHDVGKLHTKEKENNFMFNQDWADVIIEKNLGIEGLYYPKAIVERTKKIVKALDFDKHGFASKKKIRRFILSYKDEFYEICDLKDAIALENTNFTKKSQIAARWKKVFKQMKENKTPLSVAELNITGDDIIESVENINVKSIGQLLNSLLEYTLDYPSCNEKSFLIKQTLKIVKKDPNKYLEN